MCACYLSHQLQSKLTGTNQRSLFWFCPVWHPASARELLRETWQMSRSLDSNVFPLSIWVFSAKWTNIPNNLVRLGFSWRYQNYSSWRPCCWLRYYQHTSTWSPNALWASVLGSFLTYHQSHILLTKRRSEGPSYMDKTNVADERTSHPGQYQAKSKWLTNHEINKITENQSTLLWQIHCTDTASTTKQEDVNTYAFSFAWTLGHTGIHEQQNALNYTH